MFVYYSSDNCIEYRPWMFYLTFPVLVVYSFVLTASGPMPEMRSMLFLNIIVISGLVLLAYMVIAFFVLWTFGKAVCAKIGNCMYMVTLALSILSGLGVIIVLGENTVWLLAWLVHCLTGMFLVFCPLNSVDCYIFIPPFRTFSYGGLWAVISWIIGDIIFCIAIGWTVPVFLNLFSLFCGILLATIFLKIPYIGNGIGDTTLWQWVKGENPDGDLAWKDSWSAKQEEEKQKKLQEQQREESLVKREKDFLENPDIAGTEETTSILCQCGQLIHVPIRFEGKSIKCTACNHPIHVPKLEEFN